MWQQTIKPGVQRAVVGARQFSEPEAWRLFRLAAFAEAIGWSLLIIGIVITTYITPGNRDAVIIAGQIHGTIFFAYFLAATVFSISLGWSPVKTVVALAASVPPYGTLVFERWAARSRAIAEAKNYRRIEVRAIITHKTMLLAIQPRESSDWRLPGGQTTQYESATNALKRAVGQQTGIRPVIGDVQYMAESTHDKKPTLTLYFLVANSKDYADISTAELMPEVDEIAFVAPDILRLPWLQKPGPHGSKPTMFYSDTEH